MTASPLRLTIAMPAHDEEGSVEASVREALAALDALDGQGEVLVVDDGSTDATPAILARLAREDGRVRIHTHLRNLGIGGFNRALLREARGEWVFYISSDGEFDPREALRFLELAERQGADAVLGYRRERRSTLYRRAVSRSFNGLVALCFGQRFRDIGSVRLLRRAVFAPLPLYSSSAFLNAERLLVARRRGARIVEVPVEHRDRRAGKARGARPSWVRHATADLLRTRLRWCRFERYYALREGDRSDEAAA